MTLREPRRPEPKLTDAMLAPFHSMVEAVEQMTLIYGEEKTLNSLKQLVQMLEESKVTKQ